MGPSRFVRRVWLTCELAAWWLGCVAGQVSAGFKYREDSVEVFWKGLPRKGCVGR